MKSFSNTYIFTFSAVMVIAVAALLSIVALQLGPKQEFNVKVEQMQNILSSVQIDSDTKNAEELFNQYITESFVVNTEGDKVDGEAFGVDMKKQVSEIDAIKKLEEQLVEKQQSPFQAFLTSIVPPKPVDMRLVEQNIVNAKNRRQLPVFKCEKDGLTLYVLPMRGKGLWGPIWGYVALESDLNTIYGAVFDHKTETPGLGAEINQNWFQEPFRTKKIFDDAGQFVSIEVVKGGSDASDVHSVDAISGGTITSKGVEAMVFDCLSAYQPFFEKQRN